MLKKSIKMGLLIGSEGDYKNRENNFFFYEFLELIQPKGELIAKIGILYEMYAKIIRKKQTNKAKIVGRFMWLSA